MQDKFEKKIEIAIEHKSLPEKKQDKTNSVYQIFHWEAKIVDYLVIRKKQTEQWKHM